MKAMVIARQNGSEHKLKPWNRPSRRNYTSSLPTTLKTRVKKDGTKSDESSFVVLNEILKERG